MRLFLAGLLVSAFASSASAFTAPVAKFGVSSAIRNDLSKVMAGPFMDEPQPEVRKVG